jgi:hypothetical protein
MTYGQPTDPRPQPGNPPYAGPEHPPYGGLVRPPQGGPGRPQQGGADYPQHLWPDYAQQPGQAPNWQQPGQFPGHSGGQPAGQYPGGQLVARPAGSAVLGVLALIVGLAGLVAPFLPMDMTGFRQYAAVPFAVPGLALAIAALAGNRRGKPVATIGLVVNLLAAAIGAYMVVTFL